MMKPLQPATLAKIFTHIRDKRQLTYRQLAKESFVPTYCVMEFVTR